MNVRKTVAGKWMLNCSDRECKYGFLCFYCNAHENDVNFLDMLFGCRVTLQTQRQPRLTVQNARQSTKRNETCCC